MQTIETSVSVGEDRRLLMQLPKNVPAGEYEVVLVLSQRAKRVMLRLSELRYSIKQEQYLDNRLRQDIPSRMN